MQALKRKEVNFITASKRKDKKKEEAKGNKTIMILIPVILFLAVAGTIAYFYFQIVNINTLTANEMAMLSSPELAAQNEQMQQLEDTIKILEQQKAIVDKTNGILKSYVEVSKAEIEAVLDARESGITLTDISYNDGILTITASGMNYTDPPLYVQRLEKTDVFAYVDYTGFMETVTETGSTYDFTVNASLKGAEVLTDEQ